MTLNCSHITLSGRDSIETTVENLNKHGLRIVLIASEEGTLLGTISDGDIRRGLMRGLSLSNLNFEIMNNDPLFVSEDTSLDEVRELMFEYKIQQIPVLDSTMKILGIHLFDKLWAREKVTNVFVIMAGGFGTRLQPETKSLPKPLVPIGDKPILEHIILKAKMAGFTKFIISIHHLGHMIEEYFGNGDRLGVQIDYLREEFPLGTAGGLSLLGKSLTLPFIVTNADVFTDIDYIALLDFHLENRAELTLAVRLQSLQIPFGVVDIDNFRVTNYLEKPIIDNYINAGVYVLNPSVIEEMNPTVKCDMPELIDKVRKSGSDVYAFPVHEAWLDIGRPSDLNAARSYYDEFGIGENNG
jgi:dTDP-glucose pyrophosphorylase